MLKKRMMQIIKPSVLIIGLNIVLSLSSAGSSVYAQSSEKGDIGEVTPSVLSTYLIGDKKKFQEDHWMREGATGGISDFNAFKEYKNGDTVKLEGKALAGSNDYFFNFDFNREGWGNIIFEFEQFRKYYDGTGGYFALFRPTGSATKTYFETDRSLFLDIGNFKVEGIFSKEESTKCAFSYEREYRKGTKSLTSWGSVTGNTQYGSLTRSILPTFLETDEIVDKLDLKLEHTVNGIDISVEQSWEKIKVQNQKVNNRTMTLATGLFTDVRYKYEDLDSDIYTTIVRIAKELDEKVHFSTAFLYNHYRGHTKERITDQSATSYNENHPENPAEVQQNTVTILPCISILPAENWFVDIGFRWEYVNKNAAADYDRDKGAAPNGVRDELLKIKDEQGENKLGETISLKYDGMRDVVFYADADFGQELRNEINTQDSSGLTATAGNDFFRDTDTVTFDYQYTTGFKYYPVSKVDVTAECKYKYGTRDYEFESKHTTAGDITNGYRGFLDFISYTTFRPLATLNFRPVKYLSCSFRYILDITRYGVETPRAYATEFAEYKSNIYSTAITLTPKDSLYMTLSYQYKQASTETQANGNGGISVGVPSGVPNVPTYNANVKTLNFSCGYSPVKNSTITGSYSLSRIDDFDDFSRYGLPLGLENLSQDASIGLENKITSNCSVDLRYNFMEYAEGSNNGIDNYIAHLFYTALKMKF